MKIQLLLLLILFNAYFYNSCFAKNLSKDTLFVESVSFNTESIIRISCPDFERNFEKSIQFKVVTNKDTLAILDSFIRKARYATSSDDIDVRAKIIYEKEDGTSVKICINKFDVIIDGRLTKKSKVFLSFLRSLTL